MHIRVLFFLAMLFLGISFLHFQKPFSAVPVGAFAGGDSDEAHLAIKSSPMVKEPDAIADKSSPGRAPGAVSADAVPVYYQSAVSAVVDDSYTVDEAYCRVQSLGLEIPLDDEVRINSFTSLGFKGVNPHRDVQIVSSACPPGTFSEVKFDMNDQVIEYMDCRNTSAEELALSHGMFSSQDEELLNQGNKINLRSYGGLFVKTCGAETFYTRNGRFQVSADGILEDGAGCFVSDRNGQKIVMQGQSFNSKGCLASGQCVAMVNPTLGSFKVYDTYTFLATSNPSDIMIPLEETDIVNNMAEMIFDGVGIAGVDLSTLAITKKPQDCTALQ